MSLPTSDQLPSQTVANLVHNLNLLTLLIRCLLLLFLLNLVWQSIKWWPYYLPCWCSVALLVAGNAGAHLILQSATLASLQTNKQNIQINNHSSSENNIWSTIQNSLQSDKWSNGKPNHEVWFAFIVYSIQMVQTHSNVPPVSYIINARCKDCVFFTLLKLYNLVQYTKVYWCVWIANLQPCLCNKLH